MEDAFAFLTPNFLKRSVIYPGSIGTFRYRFQKTGKAGDGTVQASVYENVCFERRSMWRRRPSPGRKRGLRRCGPG